VKPAEPLLATARAEDLATNRTDRPTADNTLLRGSDAHGCERKIAFAALHIPKAITYTPEQLMAFRQGDNEHKHLQLILAERFGAELEVPISYKQQGIEVSGHADAFYIADDEPRRRVVEIKSMKQYPFDKAIGGEGPRIGDLLQGGIYAMSPQLHADAVHMAYLNKQDGALAEWIIALDDDVQAGPNLAAPLSELVHEELDRLQRIAEDVQAGMLPWRRIPGFGVIPNPNKEAGAPWPCQYCSWQPLCARLPTSKVPADALNQNGDGGAHNEEEEPYEEEPF
jgi:hypothetical protein